MTPPTLGTVESSMTAEISKFEVAEPAPLQGKYKNGLDDHAKLVENFIKQGAKFQKTMKYGFPLVARKTL